MEDQKSTSIENTDLLRDSYISFVNLDHRKDRLQVMEQKCRDRGIPAVRTRGLLPREVIDKIVPAGRVEVMRKRTPGAIGCHFSQVSIMQEAFRQGRHAWVMEDDLRICRDIQERLAYMNRFLDSHPWDIMWLGATFHVHPPWWHKSPPLCRDVECTDDPRMMRTYGAFCTYAYVVNRNSLSRVLTGLDAWLDRSIGIDWAMIQMQPSLHTYAFVPGSMIQYDNMSDIGKGMTNFSGFKKLGPYWYQKHLTDFDPTQFDWHEARQR